MTIEHRLQLLRGFIEEIRDCIEQAALSNARDEGRVRQSHHLGTARTLCDRALSRDEDLAAQEAAE